MIKFASVKNSYTFTTSSHRYETITLLTFAILVHDERNSIPCHLLHCRQ